MSHIAEHVRRVEGGVVQEVLGDRCDLPPAGLLDLMDTLSVPGVSVAVIADGAVEWARGYGVRVAGRPDPVTPETMLQAASISKPVTVIGALRLVEEGRLELDEDVNRYLKSWKIPATGEWTPRVTLRQLMCHGAGTTVHGFPGYNRRAPLPGIPQILDGQPPANTPTVRVSAIPGTQFRYSGGGTVIMQQVMTDVTGEPFPALMRELVLQPLRMEHSTYEQPLPERFESLAAAGHRTAAIPLDGHWQVYPEMAAAGLWTTPSDLARVAIDMQRAWVGSEPSLLRHETVREMLHPQVEPLIGLGFFLDGEGSSARFGHTGGNEGFLSEMTMYRESGRGGVVMTNSDAGWDLTRNVLLTIAREYAWPDYPPVRKEARPVDLTAAARYVGEYELKPDFRFTVTLEAGNLYLQPTGQAKLPLVACSDTEFFARDMPVEVAFDLDDQGRVAGLKFRQNNREMAAPRLEIEPPGRESSER